MTFKKLLILLLALSLIMLTACKGGGQNTPSSEETQESSPVTQGETLQLLFCENDTINPYKTINKSNAEIAQLIYEPLVKINSEFEPVLALAKSVEINGNLCTVSLNDAMFSDMSQVTADDVVFSCGLAKNSQRFAYLFYEVKNVYAVDSSTVAFELTKNDPYFKNLLTFPIIKAGTDNLRDEDNMEIAPIGCGRFVLSVKDSTLLPFENYYGNKANISKIKLINAPDSESVEHFVESNATDIYFTDYSDANIYRMSGIRESVNLNNLVYIGINHNNPLLATDEMRYAISSALDKNEVATKAFYGNAVAATGFFHPAFKEIAGIQTLQTTPNEKIVIENLEKIGYNSTDTKGIRKSPYGNRLSFNLLVNRDNPSKLSLAYLISEQLKRVGIEIKINEVNSSQFSSLVSDGNFQLYIGEVKILPNMDISSLVLPGGSAAAGITSPVAESVEEQVVYSNKAYISVISGFYNGKNSIADVASALISSMPVIPVVFRSGLVFHSDDISEIGEVSYTDLFLSIDKFKFEN
ncbi:MAG: hypothetical protein IKK77_00220 [Clostridia bacterium]|nr:hypothetical protein [Clostridia bacterium]